MLLHRIGRRVDVGRRSVVVVVDDDQVGLVDAGVAAVDRVLAPGLGQLLGSAEEELAIAAVQVLGPLVGPAWNTTSSTSVWNSSLEHGRTGWGEGGWTFRGGSRCRGRKCGSGTFGRATSRSRRAAASSDAGRRSRARPARPARPDTPRSKPPSRPRLRPRPGTDRRRLRFSCVDRRAGRWWRRRRRRTYLRSDGRVAVDAVEGPRRPDGAALRTVARKVTGVGQEAQAVAAVAAPSGRQRRLQRPVHGQHVVGVAVVEHARNARPQVHAAHLGLVHVDPVHLYQVPTFQIAELQQGVGGGCRRRV